MDQNNSRSTGWVGASASGREEMEAFDQLPAVIRAALRDADQPWCAADFWVRWDGARREYGEARATAAGLRLIAESEALSRASTGDGFG